MPKAAPQNSKKVSLPKWYEVGGVLSLGALVFTFLEVRSNGFGVGSLLWFNFFALLIHQFEEYGYPGYFPGYLNRIVFGSYQGLSFPLNSISSWIINVILGWGVYLLAALYGSSNAVWAIPAMMISFSNILAHIAFSLKGRRLYNPGLISSLFLFTPTVVAYIQVSKVFSVLERQDLYNGLLVGVIANALVPLLIILFARRNGKHAFGLRHDLPEIHALEEDE